jgi:ABC-type transport system substrate-binding protein
MGPQETGMRKIVVIGVVTILLGLALSCNNNPKPKNGILIVNLYSQTIQDFASSSGLSFESWIEENGVELASLIRVHGLDSEYYISDKYGRITISNVPPGSYTIHPLFMSTDHDLEVQVVSGGTTTRTIIMPDIVIQGYLVNACFQNADFRRALSVGLDRQAILTVLGWEYQPVYTALPTMFNHDGLTLVTQIEEDVEAAVELFGAATNQEFSLKYNVNDSGTNASLASQIKATWVTYATVGNVALDEADDWASFVHDVYDNHNYQIARFGWSFDTNNPVAFLLRILGDSTHASATYSVLVTGLEAAQANLDIDTLLSLIDEANTLILEEGLFIPVYER